MTVPSPGRRQDVREARAVRSAERIRLAVLAPALALCATAAGAATDPAEIERAARAVYADDDLQRTLPTASFTPIQPQPLPTPTPTGLGEVAEILLWILLVTVGLVVGGWLLRGWWQARRAAAKTAAQATVTPTEGRPAAPPGPLDEADRLAEQGRLAEAVHLLLRIALASLGRRMGDRLTDSQTSREVLRLPGLGAELRASLRPLVLAVELAIFGGRPPSHEAYREARGHTLRVRELAEART